MEGKKLMKHLHDEAMKTEVPNGIKPENIASLLEGKEVKSPEAKKRRVWIPVISGAACVACAACILGVIFIPKTKDSNLVGTTQKSEYEQVFDTLMAGETELELYSTDGTKYSDVSTGEPSETSETNTNVRTQGVDESDFVKTDGKYIYTITGKNFRTINISKVDQGKISYVNQLDFSLSDEEFVTIDELYISDNKLYVIGECGFNNKSETKIAVYDVTQPKNIEKLFENKQSGNFMSSRLVDGYVYLFSNYVSDRDLKSYLLEDKSCYVPKVNETFVGKGEIYFPQSQKATSQLVITGMSASSGAITAKADMLTNWSESYVSDDHIYVYDLYENETGITSFSYKDGIIKKIASAKVQGVIDDTFSVDEYEDCLRVLTTVDLESTTYNNIYVLNDEMKQVGTLKYLAEDERIYSARFFGNIGYFVTYRETDPLFAVDFSDTSKPKLLGYLKIPGVSNYLHLWEDGKLLGLGSDDHGMKLSMFDISNPKELKEISNKVIKDKWPDDYGSQYKGVFVNNEKNCIGFVVYNNYGDFYMCYQYKNGKFTKRFYNVLPGWNGQVSGNYRSVSIDNYMYVVRPNVGIFSYNLSDNKKANELKFAK